MASAAVAEQAMIAQDLAKFTHDPLRAVRYGFPWGTGEFDGMEGPRKWQCEVLDYVGDHFRNPDTRHQVCRIAISSGNGPGKSTLAALLSWWGLSTFEDCRINVTANTKNQLDTKTSPEFSKWFRSAINADWFDVNVTSIKVQEPGHEANWRVDFLPWSEDNPAATAGQHNVRKRLILIFDEASEIASIIYETAEGALTDEQTEIIWLLLGNPTWNSGSFYDAVFGKKRHRWKTWVLDTREIEGTNKSQINEWLTDYGEDSDWFRVHVRGLPPGSAHGQFIDVQSIQEAQLRPARCLPDDPLVAGVDFAWGGSDDNVVRFRKGLDARSIPPIKVKGEFTRNPMVMISKLTDVLARSYNGDRVAMLFLDSAGIAGPIAARLRALGHQNVMEVNFGQDATDGKFAYRRDEMWGRMKQWLQDGGAIDRDPGLEADLSKPILVADRLQRIKLESKELMQKRLSKMGAEASSPDDGDALALTFAMQVMPQKRRTLPSRPMRLSAWG